METPIRFEHQNTTFRVIPVYESCFRIIDPYGSWFLLYENKTIKEIIELAKVKIDRIFAKGFPNTNPWVGDTFIVLADEIGFRTGTHIHNLNGTGGIVAKKGDILIFDREGEDNGFWSIQGKGERFGECKGERPWTLIYNEKIQQMYQDEAFRLHKEKSRLARKTNNK